MLIQTTVVAKNLRVSPRKLNVLLSLIRGCELDEAQTRIRFSRKKAAKDIEKTIKCCVNNMQNQNTSDSSLSNCYIHEAYVGKGMTLKRVMPRAKGRGYRIRKTYSNLTIVLQKNPEVQPKEVRS